MSFLKRLYRFLAILAFYFGKKRFVRKHQGVQIKYQQKKNKAIKDHKTPTGQENKFPCPVGVKSAL